jgi:RNA polymerase sigma-70 factor, ECF subfamily
LKNSNKIQNLSDEELLLLYQKSGESVYFGELYKRYIPKTYGLCLKYLGESEAAKDAVMEIYQLLISKIRLYEIDHLNAWLYSVSKNYCLQTLRKEKQAIFVKIEDANVESDDFFTQTDKPQTPEELAALEYCLTTLSDEQQTAIKLFYYEKKSYADIADMTNYSLSKVKSYIQNGKRNLKSCILKIVG